MPERLYNNVRARTTLEDGYRKHAAPESMGYYLQDWKAAHLRLGRQIEALQAMLDARESEKATGNWPPQEARDD